MDLSKDKVLKLEVEETIKLVRIMAEWDVFTKKGHVKNDVWSNNFNLKAIIKGFECLGDYCNRIVSRAQLLDKYEIDNTQL